MLCHATSAGVRDVSPAQLLGVRLSTMDSTLERSTKDPICLLCDLLLFWKLPGFNTPMGSATYTFLLAFPLQRTPRLEVLWRYDFQTRFVVAACRAASRTKYHLVVLAAVRNLIRFLATRCRSPRLMLMRQPYLL